MKARVMYGKEVLAIKRDFPDDLAVGTELHWELAHGRRRTMLKTYVQKVSALAVADGDITHEVEVTGFDAKAQTRMVVATVPDGPFLKASDIMQMVMLVNSKIIEDPDGAKNAGLLELQRRLSDLVPPLLKGGINPSAIEIIQDI